MHRIQWLTRNDEDCFCQSAPCTCDEPIPSEGGRTLRQLHRLFDMVASKKNWKFPINAYLYCGCASRVEAFAADVHCAVVFFTGSVPVITTNIMLWGPMHGMTQLHVVADGYYRAVGA